MIYLQRWIGIILIALLTGNSLECVLIPTAWGQDFAKKHRKYYQKRKNKKHPSQRSGRYLRHSGQHHRNLRKSHQFSSQRRYHHGKHHNQILQAYQPHKKSVVLECPLFSPPHLELFYASDALSTLQISFLHKTFFKDGKDNSQRDISYPMPTDSKNVPKIEESDSPLLTIRAQSDSNFPNLLFNWAGYQPAMAIVKGLEGWWIVFDQLGKVRLPDLKEASTLGIKEIKTIPANGGVAIQVILDKALTPRVSLEQERWQISFIQTPLSLLETAPIRLPQSEKGELIVDLKNPGREVRFTDPQTGLLTIVVPSHKVGFGLADAQIFPGFQIASTAQGIAFQILQDHITATVAATNVSISHPDGLAVTRPDQRNQERNQTIPIGFFAESQGLDWISRREDINNDLLDRSHDEHAFGELELAWLYLAHGQTSVALAYLGHLAQERPSVVHLPLFQALQGLSHLLLDQISQAEASFHNVHEEPEVKVWLTLIKALQKHSDLSVNFDALRQLREEKSLLESYPKPLQSQIIMIILRAATVVNDLKTIAYFIDGQKRPENAAQKEVFDLATDKLQMSKAKAQENP